MAIEITIKQKIFGKKTMPLEVILGEHLHYGNFVNDQLNEGELGESEFIAYNPKHIGRGFSVVWNENEKRKIELRLPQPSTTQELSDFYAAVERMVTYWNAKLIVEGCKMSLSDFLSDYQEMVAFNDCTIKRFAQQVMEDELETLTLYSAKWPLSFGKEEAVTFMENTNNYASWLHTKQTIDAHYATVVLGKDENGVWGRYTFRNEVSYIFPLKPSVPFGTIDLSTGEELECKNWKVVLEIDGEKESFGELDYDDFMKRIPENKILKYDGDKIQILKMSEDEIRALMEY